MPDAFAQTMEATLKEVYGEGYRRAREAALERNPTCQFCGLFSAKHAHHWAPHAYPPDDKVGPDDLTALCELCHEVATTIRRHLRRGGSRFEIPKALEGVQLRRLEPDGERTHRV